MLQPNPGSLLKDQTIPANFSQGPITISATGPGFDLPVIGRGLWVGGAGDVFGWLAGDDISQPARPYRGVAAGTHIPYAFKRLASVAGGTTATNITIVW